MVLHFWGAKGAGDLCFVATIKKRKLFIVNQHRDEKEASLVMLENGKYDRLRV